MKLRWLPVLLVACLGLCGCPSYSLNPLYTSQDAVVEPGLEGTWISTDPDEKDEMIFQKSASHTYKSSYFDPHTKITRNYDVNLVRMGGKLLMDIQYDAGTLDGANVDEPIGMLSMHVIMKVELLGDDLAFATLEDDAIKKQGVKELKYQVFDQGNLVLVTAETDDLRKYVAAHAEDGFSQFDHWKRVRKTAN
jgi:hypothetical protein